MGLSQATVRGRYVLSVPIVSCHNPFPPRSKDYVQPRAILPHDHRSRWYHPACVPRKPRGHAASTAVFGAAAHAFAAPSPPAAPARRKIKLGFVGCGGRGAWLAGLFQKNGGYEMYALADYFQSAVDKCGDALDIDKRRRFTGLSGYKKVLESGVEAVAILDIPYFYAEQVQAAVNAGCHVYMAKPVATDVPGCLAVETAAKQATEKRLCFHVDYQMPTDPVNIEIAQRISDGAIGKILSISTWGSGGGTGMSKKTPRGERRLKTSCKT